MGCRGWRQVCSRQTEGLWWCRLLARSSQACLLSCAPRIWLGHPEAARARGRREPGKDSGARPGRGTARLCPPPGGIVPGSAPPGGSSPRASSAERTPSPPGTAPERGEQGRGRGPAAEAVRAREGVEGAGAGVPGTRQRRPRLLQKGGAGEHGPDAAARALRHSPTSRWL